jgi:hypothetical protein
MKADVWSGSSSNAVTWTIDKSALGREIALRTAEAFRDGIPGAVLDGLASLGAEGRVVLLDRKAERLELLRDRLESAARKETRARRLAIEEEDERVADGYRADARHHAQDQRLIQTQIAELETDNGRPNLPDVFEGEVEYLLAGVSCLLRPLVSRDEPDALSRVLELELFEVSPRQLGFRVYWLVPAGGGVVRFGPIGGTVPCRSRNLTPAEKDRLSGPTTTTHDRRIVTHSLLVAGYSELASLVATNCPFPELVQALLSEDPTWPGVPDGFDHAEFNAHLTSEFRKLVHWRKTSYCYAYPKRQVLTDAVAALGGRASIVQVARLLRPYEVSLKAIYQLTVAGNTETRSSEPCAHRVGKWSKHGGMATKLVESIQCVGCGEPATAVTRIPEVSGSLICRRCMLDAKGRLYPSCYGELSYEPTQFGPGEIEAAKNVSPDYVRWKKDRTSGRSEAVYLDDSPTGQD